MLELGKKQNSGRLFAGTPIPHLQFADNKPPATHGIWFNSNL